MGSWDRLPALSTSFDKSPNRWRVKRSSRQQRLEHVQLGTEHVWDPNVSNSKVWQKKEKPAPLKVNHSSLHASLFMSEGPIFEARTMLGTFKILKVDPNALNRGNMWCQSPALLEQSVGFLRREANRRQNGDTS